MTVDLSALAEPFERQFDRLTNDQKLPFIVKEIGRLGERMRDLHSYVDLNEASNPASRWAKDIESMNAKAAEISDEIFSIKARAEKQLQEQTEQLAEHLQIWERAVKEKIALDQIGDTWKKKEFWHKLGAGSWAGVFLFFIGMLALYIYHEGIPRAVELLSKPDGQEIPYAETILRLLVYAVPSAAMLAFVIWALRIVVRMFFTERALAEDAADRRAMIKTLTGLALDKGFDNQQRMIVMRALFRQRQEYPINDGSPMEAFQSVASASLKRG